MATRPRLHRTEATPEEQEVAIIAAATEEFADVGVRRASMDRIAQMAHVSRSTLYRRFPSKVELVTAVGKQVGDDLFGALHRRTAGLGAQEAVVVSFCEAFRQIKEIRLLRRLFEIEPESVESLLGLNSPVHGLYLDQTIRAIVHILESAGATMSREDLTAVAEIQMRVATSMLQAPSIVLDITDDDAVRAYAQRYLAPMVH